MYWNLYVIKPGNYTFPVKHYEGEEFGICGDLTGESPTNLTDEGLIKAMHHIRENYQGEFVSFMINVKQTPAKEKTLTTQFECISYGKDEDSGEYFVYLNDYGMGHYSACSEESLEDALKKLCLMMGKKLIDIKHSI